MDRSIVANAWFWSSIQIFLYVILWLGLRLTLRHISFLGSNHWGDTYDDDCKARGEHSSTSSIDFNVNETVTTRLPPLISVNYGTVLLHPEIRNNGYTGSSKSSQWWKRFNAFKFLLKLFFSVEIFIPESANIRIVGGGLPSPYILQQLHFQWGTKKRLLSYIMSRFPVNDTVKEAFPLEARFRNDRKLNVQRVEICLLQLHLIHVKAGLSLKEAREQPDGLAVLGVLFATGESPIPLHDIAHVLPSLMAPSKHRSTVSSSWRFDKSIN